MRSLWFISGLWTVALCAPLFAQRTLLNSNFRQNLLHMSVVLAKTGHSVPLATKLSPGHPSVIEIFATWCGPCRAEAPEMEQLFEKYRGDGLQVIGMSIENPAVSLDKVRAFTKSAHLQYPVVFAPRSLRGNITVPDTLIYDADGRLVAHFNRYMFLWTDRRIATAVRKVVQSSETQSKSTHLQSAKSPSSN
jgi:thiol-disulfide isomerase/thioredoxin